MQSGPSVIVQKSGFLASVARGLFGFLTAGVVCGAGLGFYAMHITDRKLDRFITTGEQVLRILPDWQKILPPALSDAVADRRDPAYRQNVEVSARLVPPGRRGTCEQAVIEVRNNGSQTISLMSVRLVLEDADSVPVAEFVGYAATPLALEDEWRGPILPGQTRRFTMNTRHAQPGLTPAVEVTELRIWTGSLPAQPATATENQPAPVADRHLDAP